MTVDHHVGEIMDAIGTTSSASSRATSTSAEALASPRVGNAERERTGSELGQALALGYLSMEEYELRFDAALRARTVADLHELLADLPADRMARADPLRREARRVAAVRGVRIHLALYLLGVLVAVAVWAVTAVASGAWYFWPIWPILGGGMGMLSHALPVAHHGRGHRA
jgi:hypothetical protein